MAKPSKKAPQWRILIASGVNLDLLGQREPEIYGRRSLADLPALLNADAQLTFFQSNDEAAFLAKLSEGWDGAVLNPGAWTHTSLALADRLKGLGLPFVEVHLSNLAAREPFRQHSYSAPHAVGVVYGFGLESYQLGLKGLLAALAKAQSSSS